MDLICSYSSCERIACVQNVIDSKNYCLLHYNFSVQLKGRGRAKPAMEQVDIDKDVTAGNLLIINSVELEKTKPLMEELWKSAIVDVVYFYFSLYIC